MIVSGARSLGHCSAMLCHRLVVLAKRAVNLFCTTWVSAVWLASLDASKVKRQSLARRTVPASTVVP